MIININIYIIRILFTTIIIMKSLRFIIYFHSIISLSFTHNLPFFQLYITHIHVTPLHRQLHYKQRHTHTHSQRRFTEWRCRSPHTISQIFNRQNDNTYANLCMCIRCVCINIRYASYAYMYILISLIIYLTKSR